MPTRNQLAKNPRVKKIKPNRSVALKGCPQKKGVIRKVFITTPKKPNSALRKVAQIRLSTKNVIFVHIPGEGHTLQKYSNALVRGGKVPDLPGIKYRLVRGKYDFVGVANRKRARSKYGRKKDK